MTKLDQLYDLRARVDAAIAAEVKRLENEARRERQRLARLRRSAKAGAKCGTDGGYYRHRRTLREDACDPCKKAHREAEAQRKSRRLERAA